VWPAAAIGEAVRRGAGFFLVVARLPDRAPDFDLVERVPERAAVLLGMAVSLVATAP
jgi:hypothetical protein